MQGYEGAERIVGERYGGADGATGKILDDDSGELDRESGTFTGTLTGVTTTETATIAWTRSGADITLTCSSNMSGVSNSSAKTITGLPSGIQPTTTQRCDAGPYIRSGSNNHWGKATVTASSGTITLELLTVSGTHLQLGSWPTALVQGVQAGWTIRYSLD